MSLRLPKEVAERLCVAEGTLTNWRVQGRGPAFVRVGRKICYRDEDVEAFIQSGLRTSTSQGEAAA